MPLLLVVVPYIICGGVLWLIVAQCSPVNSTTSLWQVIVVVFLLGVAQRIWPRLLGQPSWLLDTSVHFVVLVVLLIALIRLSLSRALAAAAIYFAVFLGLSAVIRITTNQ